MPFQKNKGTIRYIAVDSLVFDQENSLITIIIFFSPLLSTRKPFTPISCNTGFFPLYNSSFGQQLLHTAAISPMGFRFCHGKNFCLVSPRIQENMKSTSSLITGIILECFTLKYCLVTQVKLLPTFPISHHIKS